MNDVDPPPPAFSLVAPTVFRFPAEQELIELGEEQLFRGTRSGAVRRSDDAVAGPSSERLRTDLSSSEVSSLFTWGSRWTDP